MSSAGFEILRRTTKLPVGNEPSAHQCGSSVLSPMACWHGRSQYAVSGPHSGVSREDVMSMIKAAQRRYLAFAIASAWALVPAMAANDTGSLAQGLVKTDTLEGFDRAAGWQVMSAAQLDQVRGGFDLPDLQLKLSFGFDQAVFVKRRTRRTHRADYRPVALVGRLTDGGNANNDESGRHDRRDPVANCPATRSGRHSRHRCDTGRNAGRRGRLHATGSASSRCQPNARYVQGDAIQPGCGDRSASIEQRTRRPDRTRRGRPGDRCRHPGDKPAIDHPGNTGWRRRYGAAATGRIRRSRQAGSGRCYKRACFDALFHPGGRCRGKPAAAVAPAAGSSTEPAASQAAPNTVVANQAGTVSPPSITTASTGAGHSEWWRQHRWQQHTREQREFSGRDSRAKQPDDQRIQVLTEINASANSLR